MRGLKNISEAKLVEMYKKMVEIRKFEEAASKLCLEGQLPGLIHVYIGEEAVAVGVCAALRDDDYVTSTHRGHGHCIAKGGDVKRMMAELFGKATGYGKGKGGSMHICVPEIGVIGCSGVVGAGIPIASGVGLAIKSRGTGQVCACFFGDGGSNTGAFHEGINLAAVWKLPVIYVCENNLYAISMPISKATAVENIADKAVAYGIPGVVVDGMDLLAVYEAASKAVERARKGQGPTLIECKTYRFRGHFEGDPKRGATYRSEEEMKRWEEKCPIKSFRAKLISANILKEEEISQIEETIASSVEEAIRFARESPYPSPDEVLKDLFFP